MHPPVDQTSMMASLDASLEHEDRAVLRLDIGIGLDREVPLGIVEIELDGYFRVFQVEPRLMRIRLPGLALPGLIAARALDRLLNRPCSASSPASGSTMISVGTLERSGWSQRRKGVISPQEQRSTPRARPSLVRTSAELPTTWNARRGSFRCFKGSVSAQGETVRRTESCPCSRSLFGTDRVLDDRTAGPAPESVESVIDVPRRALILDERPLGRGLENEAVVDGAAGIGAGEDAGTDLESAGVIAVEPKRRSCTTKAEQWSSVSLLVTLPSCRLSRR